MNFIVSKKKLYSPIVAFISTLILCLIPWDEIREVEYYDRENYVNYIDNTLNKINWFDFDGLLSKITFEWGWHKLLQFLTEGLNLNSTIILFSISFFILFSSSIFLIRRHNYFSFLFLINPVFIDFCFSQMRLAFTMFLVYLAYYLQKRGNLLYIPLLLATPFLHTSAVLFIFLFAVSIFINKLKYPAEYTKTMLAFLSGLTVSVVTGPLMSIILGEIGDRRAEYSDMSSPILYMSFWVVMLPYFLMKGFLEKGNKDFSFYLTIMILSMIGLNIVFSGYSSRFLAACYPVIISALLSLKGKEKPIILISYSAFTIVLWMFWLT
ncbi:hypothetical protein [Acinetobacter baumannii]|uniref:hypothetical protein n=1 Tax=Acinetobacter baumannii TaxID=470 RepID=UPI003989AA45